MLGNIYAFEDGMETDRMNSMFGNGWELLGLEETYESNGGKFQTKK